jgi:hypothetical protein
MKYGMKKFMTSVTEFSDFPAKRGSKKTIANAILIKVEAKNIV